VTHIKSTGDLPDCLLLRTPADYNHQGSKGASAAGLVGF
jgi:hypothetical protein